MLYKNTFCLKQLLILSSLLLSSVVSANEKSTEKGVEEKSSSWLATPLISSDPKLGTNGGALVGYMHHFDEKSPVSMIGTAGIYSDTDSYGGNVFGNLYFDEDSQRLLTSIGFGNVKNDYTYEREGDQDISLKTTDDIKMAFLRYSHRVDGDWYLGAQIVHSNYIISGGDAGSDLILDLLDLVGFDSTALGMVATFDSRNNQQSASSGHNFVFHQFAYRKSFGGDESFDAYQMNYSTYLSHGKGHVAAVRVKGRWTNNAPSGGFSSMEVRGYIRGQYLAEHSTFVEIDERYALTERWGLTAFAGVGCLYGDNLAGERQKCSHSENLYPGIGGGVSFALKPEEKIVVRAEVAAGKEGNYGFYMKFGQPF